MLFVVLALSAPAVQGQVFSSGRCPNVPVVQNFQLDRWLGTWIEIARFPNSLEANLHCANDTAARHEDGRILSWLNGIRDSLGVNSDPLYGVANPEESAKFSFHYFSNSFLPEMPFWILEVDYDLQIGYYVGYTCYDIGIINMQLLWILSKERQMDEVKLNGILGRLQGYGIDTSKLEYPRQDDTCPALP